MDPGFGCASRLSLPDAEIMLMLMLVLMLMLMVIVTVMRVRVRLRATVRPEWIRRLQGVGPIVGDDGHLRPPLGPRLVGRLLPAAELELLAGQGLGPLERKARTSRGEGCWSRPRLRLGPRPRVGLQVPPSCPSSPPFPLRCTTAPSTTSWMSQASLHVGEG